MEINFSSRSLYRRSPNNVLFLVLPPTLQLPEETHKNTTFLCLEAHQQQQKSSFYRSRKVFSCFELSQTFVHTFAVRHCCRCFALFTFPLFMKTTLWILKRFNFFLLIKYFKDCNYIYFWNADKFLLQEFLQKGSNVKLRVVYSYLSLLNSQPASADFYWLKCFITWKFIVIFSINFHFFSLIFLFFNVPCDMQQSFYALIGLQKICFQFIFEAFPVVNLYSYTFLSPVLCANPEQKVNQ